MQKYLVFFVVFAGMSLMSCKSNAQKIVLLCQSQVNGIESVALTIDTDASTVREEMSQGGGCTQVSEIANNVRRPMSTLVGCPYALSQDPDDLIVDIQHDVITFGVKTNPQRLDRSNGVLRGANGVIFGICTPAGTGNKF